MLPDAPLVISGLGGSGTRVPAAMCRVLGFDMGADRNSADDDLLFTLLLKRRSLLQDALQRGEEQRVGEALDAFVRLRGRSATGAGPAVSEALRAAGEMVVHGVERRTAVRRALWGTRRFVHARPGRAAGPWGFKEPTAHLYLPQLLKRFPGLRYVHVVRSPQDYAVKAHNQFLLWGPLLGVAVPQRPQELPAAQLRYWVKANQRAVRIAGDAGALVQVVRLEDAMSEPLQTAQALASALQLDPPLPVLEQMASVAVPHPSRGRGAALDVAALLDAPDLAVVRDFGYLTAKS